MTPSDRIQLAKLVLIEMTTMPGINPIHLEYLQTLLQKIEEQVIPILDKVTEDGSRTLFDEAIKISSVMIYKREKKIPSFKITKKVTSKYVKDGKLTYENFKSLKSSRYGLSMMNMNFNQFMKGIEK